MCRMLIAIGNVNLDSVFEGMKDMAEDKGHVTTNMIPLLSDKKVQKMFITRGPKHSDGWGIAFLEKNNFIIKKSLNPIYEETKTKDIKNIKTKIAMLHTRFKSIGENKLENNAPFQNGEYIFCHNGTIRKKINFDKKKYTNHGDTDSERFFLSILSKDLPIEKAIKDSFNELPLKPNSNIIISNKNKTYVYSSSRTLQKYFRMKMGRLNEGLIISSEIIPQLNIKWEEVPFDKVIEVNHHTLTIAQH